MGLPCRSRCCAGLALGSQRDHRNRDTWNPAHRGFRVGATTREWNVGEAFVFDDTIEHEAWNRSDRLRAVLIFDVWNPYISEAERELLRRFFAVTNASAYAGDEAVSVG